jgi:hypothetical protein
MKIATRPSPKRAAWRMAFDEMTRIRMTEDARKFDRAGLTRLPGDRMNLPSARTLTDAFRMPGRDEHVCVERDETGKKRRQCNPRAKTRKFWGK